MVIDGEEKVVDTKDLTLGGTPPEGKELAVIYAPSTGKASLREKASEKGKLLKTTKAGTLVRVLEVNGAWAKIVYKDTIGYIKTNCLRFYEAGDENQGTALISYKGKTNGSTTVNIRNAATRDSFKIAEWRTGTPVTVFGLEKGWYEVEAKGIRGFVMEEFLTVE